MYNVCMRINVSIDNRLLKDFDDYCDHLRYNRSELLSKLMRDVVYNVHKESMADSSTVERRPVKADAEGSSPSLPAKELKGWCMINRAHPFIKGREFEIKKFTWEDENGNPVVNGQWGCIECIKYYENLGKGKVIYG